MTSKKVCLLGASGVGKTSLVRRFVRDVFSDIYRTTIGVQIERQRVVDDGQECDLMLWDLEGDDAFAQVQLAYLRGASGYLLVVDGTRVGTLDTALRLDGNARQVLGPQPRVLLINKLDRFDEWELSDREVARLLPKGYVVIRSSAKTGAGVAEAFAHLTHALLQEGSAMRSRVR